MSTFDCSSTDVATDPDRALAEQDLAAGAVVTACFGHVPWRASLKTWPFAGTYGIVERT
jgi:hypothetical protein